MFSKTTQELIERMANLGVTIINQSRNCKTDYSVDVVLKQLIRCSTSVGANYRSACRPKSRKDFIYKLKLVEEELDETIHWIDIYNKIKLNKNLNFEKSSMEAKELLSIIIQSTNTARRNGKTK